jgi:hypothetical protein
LLQQEGDVARDIATGRPHASSRLAVAIPILSPAFVERAEVRADRKAAMRCDTEFVVHRRFILRCEISRLPVLDQPGLLLGDTRTEVEPA